MFYYGVSTYTCYIPLANTASHGFQALSLVFTSIQNHAKYEYVLTPAYHNKKYARFVSEFFLLDRDMHIIFHHTRFYKSKMTCVHVMPYHALHLPFFYGFTCFIMQLIIYPLLCLRDCFSSVWWICLPIQEGFFFLCMRDFSSSA